MPRRDDLHTIMILGSGPIVIGQAGEFDYSGTQGARALREEGYRVVLVNSNPATIMTDPSVADRTYVEPLDVAAVEAVIAIERPDALLPTLGGQTALNLAMDLSAAGVLERLRRRADRRRRRRDPPRRGPRGLPRHDGRGRARRRRPATWSPTSRPGAPPPRELGLPVILRPGFTLGGEGGGAAHTPEELERRLDEALAASPIGQVLVEQSVLGWAEIELEVVRDVADNAVIVCSIENIDPMGVHTGDSVTVAPGDDPHRPGAAGPARRGDRRHPRGRRLHRRRQRPVRPQPRDRRDRRHRDEPARVAQLGAGVQGHRLPDRQDRGPPGGGLHARRAAQRDHRRHARELRADARLRRGQDPALRVREAARRVHRADHPHEERRRGAGPRAAPSARRSARRWPAASWTWRRADPARRWTTPWRCCAPPPGTASTSSCGRWSAAPAWRPSTRRPAIDLWFLEQLAELAAARAALAGPLGDARTRTRCAPRGARASPTATSRRPSARPSARSATGAGRSACAPRTTRSTPAPPSSRPLTPYYYSAFESEDELARDDRAVDRRARLGAEPDRAGDRVRLLLRPRGARPRASWATRR